jgi:hypothetical protein
MAAEARDHVAVCARPRSQQQRPLCRRRLAHEVLRERHPFSWSASLLLCPSGRKKKVFSHAEPSAA